MSSMYVWCTFQKEGFHAYPDAPKEVTFLKLLHRHIFHFRVEIAVTHDNRDIEFLTLKKWCLQQYADEVLQIGNMSCEMLARELATRISEHPVFGRYWHSKDIRESIYPICVTVSEDEENGATFILN